MKHIVSVGAIYLALATIACGQVQSPAPKDYSQLLAGRYDVREAKRLLQQTVVYPRCVEEQKAQGKTEHSVSIFSLTVDKEGRGGQVDFTVTKQISRACAPEIEAAIRAAVQRLPRFRPAQENGVPVPVELRMGMEFPPPDPEDYGKQEPEVRANYPGGDAALDKALGFPSKPLTRADSVNVVSVLLSVRPDGRVGRTRLMSLSQPAPGYYQGIYAQTMVRRLAVFTPAKSNGKSVGSEFILSVYCPAEEKLEELAFLGQLPVAPVLPPLPLKLLPIPESFPTAASAPSDYTLRPGAAPTASRSNADAPRTLDGSPVYGYVQQMPTLAPPHEKATVSTAILENLVVSDDVRSGKFEGLVRVAFTVDAQGTVRDPKMVQGLCEPCDEAVLAAARHLKFVPGQQNGQPVPVFMRVDVPFKPSPPAPAKDR
ncbi:energy transducer TonB [Hymenobacter yonginensis]|uniref:Energy transducer TonB n=1 Tax=Hymenobacter yonginensis TaxID=748197 RepID=A0ABY7PT57_9BACT|nr:energy transducer TonB [Hymenobacter yonginensis]WBO86091.1 energy transducer TonB [Hymenobacter yonginensis]